MKSYAGIIRDLPEGMRWSYRVHCTGGSTRPEHIWTLANERGGIHVAAWQTDGRGIDRWIGGIEVHSPVKMYEGGKDAPDHEHCWLLGKPCWHDGSSLQFSEEIAPVLPPQSDQMNESVHGYILSIMLSRHRTWLPTPAPTADATRKGEE